MRNDELHRRLAFAFRNILRVIHRIFAFLNFRRFDRWLLPHASCIYIANKEGQVLAVSRKNDPTKFGLPGGKVDQNETDERAAIRELYEETGIRVSGVSLRKIFEDTDDFEYWTTCYFACLLYTPIIGEVAPEESGVVKWVDRSVLTSGIFGTFNTKLFNTIDQHVAEKCLFCGANHA